VFLNELIHYTKTLKGAGQIQGGAGQIQGGANAPPPPPPERNPEQGVIETIPESKNLASETAV